MDLYEYNLEDYKRREDSFSENEVREVLIKLNNFLK